MIEVFKTNVQGSVQARKIIDLLQQYFPDNKINIDLHDCDKILRVEGENFQPEKIKGIVVEYGFNCDILND